jgi:hypothetical protein
MCDLGARLAGAAMSGGAEEVPSVAGDVEEDRDSVIGFGPRFLDEDDTGLRHAQVGGVEVVDAEEEPDSSGYLVADCGTLVFSVCAGEQNSGLGARRAGRPPTAWVAHH